LLLADDGLVRLVGCRHCLHPLALFSGRERADIINVLDVHQLEQGVVRRAAGSLAHKDLVDRNGFAVQRHVLPLFQAEQQKIVQQVHVQFLARLVLQRLSYRLNLKKKIHLVEDALVDKLATTEQAGFAVQGKRFLQLV